MDRLACLDLPALPLQLLVRVHPTWRGEPAVVVESDTPHGLVVWTNRAAREAGVLPGLRYAAALGLCARLRAGVIASSEIERAVAEILVLLQRFSPHVEPCAGEPGVFWIDGHGLERLFGAPRTWAESIRTCMRDAGFESRMAVGARRFTTYATAKALGRVPLAVFDDLAHEREVAARVDLARLSLQPEVRDALRKLGLVNVGDFARLPSGGILQRFGTEAHRLHRMAAGLFEDDFAPAQEVIPLTARVDLELPEANLERLLAHVHELAHPLCTALARRGEAATAIELRFELDDRTTRAERLAPARPTVDPEWLVRLLRMRLASKPAFSAGATTIAITLAHAPVHAEQASLFVETRARSAAAAAKAFSALRAAFGELAVTRARLVSAHLPEHGFVWERCDALVDPQPRRAQCPPLVRTLFRTAQKLPPRSRHEPDGWLLHGVCRASVARLSGPYRLSGGWWRAEVAREYYFAELADGEIAWIYYDVHKRRWLRQGCLS
ncbi:MAG: Y-family DNA polymerase [Planctomycetota bacterium]